MFSKTERSDVPSGLPSIVSKDMTITGNIESPGTVQVEGKVVGDIECHELTLGEGGEVHGQVKCEVADIHGTVVGELQVTNLSISASASINGDIVHENVSIEAHARVEGKLVRRESQQTNLNLVSDESS
ncbi:MAG: polymer-forming cytoskeletal protein [Alphaproteobacteria bacterium]|nr:polymer-forming cytoskeletal protein [Alphaproteobacteria bacterium]